MFGFRVISDRYIELQTQLTETRIALLAASLREKDEYIRKLEALVDHERSRVLDEQERADRATDNLLQQNGTPPITATVRREAESKQEEQADAEKKLQDQMAEICRESVDNQYDDFGHELPPEFLEAVTDLMNIKKSN